MRILFLGTPDFAVSSLQALIDSPDHEVVAVVSQPDKPQGRKMRVQPSPVKALALNHDLPVETPESFRKSHPDSDALLERLRGYHADIWVTAAFGHILPQRFLDVPKIDCLNVHASLLPRHRGASPINAAILAGDDATGITIMRMVKEMDAGPVYLQWSVPIKPKDTAGELFDVLAKLGGKCLLEALSQIEHDDLQPTEQDHDKATHCGMLNRSDGLLDWSMSTAELDRRIRGFDPWPGTFSFILGKRLQILRASPFNHPLQRNAAPGQIFGAVGGRGVLVCTQDGGLLLEQVKPEGKRAMGGDDFYQGLPKDQRDGLFFANSPDEA